MRLNTVINGGYMQTLLKYKTNETIFLEAEKEEIPYLDIPLLRNTGIVDCAFSTRLGGVSKGIYSSMNISFTRGDEEEAVRENLRRMAKVLEVKPSQFVYSNQLHTDRVVQITKREVNEGIPESIAQVGIDGLVTDIKGACLVTYFADCVPLYFVDPIQKAIGLTHSGWKGTVLKIGMKTVEKMETVFGSKREDILAVVGPSICQDCYEVSSDVIEAFKKAFDKSFWSALFYETRDDKYQLNLWEANRQVLREAGLVDEHIAVTNVCTGCNQESLFSHRKTNGKRGNLGAFLVLK